ncbi:MAG: YdcF family protein [Bacteroidetes bacterium]|nr:YdcF family protein [Bacteroidota bacterium]
MNRKRLLTIGAAAILGLACILSYRSMLEGVGTALIDTDEPQPAQAIFVLAGGPVERGNYAAQLYHRKLAPAIYCTGEIEPEILSMFCDTLNEGEITREVLIRANVPDSVIQVIPSGTSTLEECYDILRFCMQAGIRRIMVVSTAQHTRRISLILRPRARRLGITVRIVGAPPDSYLPQEWYKAEEGLLFVTNEYLKLAYYLYKY